MVHIERVEMLDKGSSSVNLGFQVVPLKLFKMYKNLFLRVKLGHILFREVKKQVSWDEVAGMGVWSQFTQQQRC